jgi:hypothetical protein
MCGLEKIKVTQKTGNEILKYNECCIGRTLLDFWKWNTSDLLSNATRGTFAEFIVATALEIDLSNVREEWKAYDLETKNGIKIEIKTSAYLQSWFQNDYSKIIFSIKPAHYWDSDTNRQSESIFRPSDVYVFCLLKHKHKETVDPLNLNQWDFYVLSTKKINNYRRSKSSITLKSLEKLTESINYSELKEKILNEYKE